MISADIQVLDMHPEHWARLLRSMTPPGGLGSWALLLEEKGAVIHAVSSLGSLPDLLGRSSLDAATLRAELGVDRILILEHDALRRILKRADADLALGQDFFEQWLKIWGAFRSERGRGLKMDPPTLPGPLPPFFLLEGLFQHLWPDDTSLVLYVVDEVLDRTFTSLILRKRKGQLDLISSDRCLGEHGLRADDWRRDRGRALELIRRQIAPCHAACFCSLDAWRIFLNGPIGSAALARQQALENWIMEPLPWIWGAGLSSLSRGLRIWKWLCRSLQKSDVTASDS